MNSEKFKAIWKSKFPEAYPIGYELKWVYENRWFRIHSLPESKRYAATAAEYQIIFERQNEIIDELIGEGAPLILLFGMYSSDIKSNTSKEVNQFGEFQKVDTLELHNIRPAEYDEEMYLDIYVKEITWKSNQQNELLKAIAEDEIRMMLISPKKNRIINPYDGGVDLILESTEIRNKYKEKYKKWLSKHPKGL